MVCKQVNWESIEKLKSKRVDLWVLLPSGVIINRFLDKKGKLIFSKNLQSFFGLSIDELKKHFYKIEEQETLFGIEEKEIKVPDAISKIAKLYVERLKTIFKQVTEEPLKLLNSKNVSIYHFVFASNNEAAVKIASQIIGKTQ